MTNWVFDLTRANWHPPLVEPERAGDDIFRHWVRPWAWAKLPGFGRPDGRDAMAYCREDDTDYFWRLPPPPSEAWLVSVLR